LWGHNTNSSDLILFDFESMVLFDVINVMVKQQSVSEAESAASEAVCNHDNASPKSSPSSSSAMIPVPITASSAAACHVDHSESSPTSVRDHRSHAMFRIPSLSGTDLSLHLINPLTPTVTIWVNL